MTVVMGVVAIIGGSVQGPVQFRSSVLEVFQEDVLLVGGVFVVVLGSRLHSFVFVERTLGEIPGASADQINDGGALQLHGFVLVTGGGVLEVVQMGVGPVEGVVVVFGDLLQIDWTRIVGSVEAVDVEGFAPVECLVGSGGFDWTGVSRR